jgi:hypothetical protein
MIPLSSRDIKYAVRATPSAIQDDVLSGGAF